MDVNIATDVKGYGTPVVANVEIEDAKRPAISPVEPSSKSDPVALDKKAQLGTQGDQLSSKTDGEIDAKEMKKVVDEVQKRMDAIGSKLSFGLKEHKDIHQMVVQITDKDSGKLVKQFPAEEVIQIREKLNDLIGLLFDKQA